VLFLPEVKYFKSLRRYVEKSQFAKSKKDRNFEFVQIYVGLLITGQPTFEQSLNTLCAVSSGGEVFQIVTSIRRKISQIAKSKKDRNFEFVQIYVGLSITEQPTYAQSLNALCAVYSG